MQESSTGRPTKVWNKLFISLVLIEVCLQFGSYSTRPIMSNYALYLGAAVATAGFIAGLNMITALVLRPVTGWISDRISKKAIMAGAAAVFAISAFACALAWSVPMLAGICIFMGVACALKSISVFAMVPLVVPADRVGSGVGYLGLVNTLATALGPMFGNWMCNTWSFQVCYTVSGVLLTAGFVLCVLFKAPETAKGHKTAVQASEGTKDSAVTGLLAKFLFVPAIPIMLIMAFVSISYGSISMMIMTVEEIGYLQGGTYYFAAYAIAAFAARPLSGRLSDSFGLAAVAMPGLVIAMVGVGLVAFNPSALTVVAMGLCMGLGQASAQCALQAEAMRGASPEELGRASNTFYMGFDIGMGFGPSMGGFVLQHFGASEMFLFNVGCLALGFVLVAVMALVRRRRREQRL